MSNSLFAAFAVLSPMVGLWRKFTTARRPAVGPRQSHADTRREALVSPATELTCRPRVVTASRARNRMNAPLRVLRVVDSSQPAHGGRMVISGRMADVCAELERMAEREAALGIGV